MVAPATESTECFVHDVGILASAGSAKETRSRHGFHGWLRPSNPFILLRILQTSLVLLLVNHTSVNWIGQGHIGS